MLLMFVSINDICDVIVFWWLLTNVILLPTVLFNIAIPFVFVAMSLSCVVNTAKCDANVKLCPVISDEFELILLEFVRTELLKLLIRNVVELTALKFEVIVAFELLIKNEFEEISLAVVVSLMAFADIVGNIDVIVKPYAVVLLKLDVIVAP